MPTFVSRLPARISAALVAATVALAAPAAGQTGPLPRDSTARVERLAEGVYAIIHDDATDQWPTATPGSWCTTTACWWWTRHTFLPVRVRTSRSSASVTSRVAAMARRGKPVEQIQDSLGLEDVRRKVPARAGEELDADWDYTVRAVIERAWRGVRGQG